MIDGLCSAGVIVRCGLLVGNVVGDDVGVIVVAIAIVMIDKCLLCYRLLSLLSM